MTVEQLCENMGETGQRWSANRPLTHPLDLGEEGLAMNATPSKTCEICGTAFLPRPNERPVTFGKRRFCSWSCRGRNRTAAEGTLTQRPWAKITVAGPEDCWLWTAATTGNGYGVIGRGGGHRNGNILAHVAVYLEKVGEIPDGYQVDHLCRTTLCCNPAHLEAVTQQENLRRQAAAVKAGRTSCRKGLHLWPENMRVTPSGWRYCWLCSKASGAARSRRRKAATGC